MIRTYGLGVCATTPYQTLIITIGKRMSNLTLLTTESKTYHLPKPVYDVAEFIRHLTDSIGQIIDIDPDAVFVLTGDLNRLNTTDLQSKLGLNQIVIVPTHNKTSLTNF